MQCSNLTVAGSKQQCVKKEMHSEVVMFTYGDVYINEIIELLTL